MKVSTWIPKPAPLPRTLADVPSPEHEIELHVPMPRNVKATFQLEKRSGETDDIDPELDHILNKLKPLTDRAADVRRIKRECYQKLAALLPEEMR